MEPPFYQVFTYDKLKVFFKHTDYHGFIHPYNYLEWMSYTRESFFQELVPNFLDLCSKNIKMVTMDVEFTQLDDAQFGDKIIVKIHSERVRRLSFNVIFRFYRERNEVLLGNGRMTLTFLDAITGKPTFIPDELKQVVLLFENRPSVGLTKSDPIRSEEIK